MPLWMLALDYVLGAIMWTLIGRAALSLFLSEDSPWGFMRIIVRLTNPLLRLFKPITPGFLVALMVPLFVAWFFYMLRFYVLPYVYFGGDAAKMAILSFPLESDIARLLASLVN